MAPLHGCCLAGIPEQAEEGMNWTCDACGTRWVFMTDRGKSAFYRAKNQVHV